MCFKGSHGCLKSTIRNGRKSCVRPESSTSRGHGGDGNPCEGLVRGQERQELRTMTRSLLAR